ncbi:hypothetical protein AB0383_42635 [Amycolatopsis sp. NPDC051373]|uniref:hypothetical protein n=1 Tax=Amycolatopsis sp. NPDC051373 TaxID=3155801 RepID=UPI00344FD06B
MSDEHDLPEFSDVSTQDLVGLFGDLEELVVSLARLMSGIGSGADPSILVQYMADRSIRARLAP